MGASAVTITPDAAAGPPVTITPDAGASAPPSALSRFGQNLLSGLGIGSNEDAKNFFEHPIKTAMDSLNAQGDLAKKAKAAYDQGDYKSAIIHGLNYLVPFIGQQTDKAGEQIAQGDYAGAAGRTLGTALPIVAGSPEVQSAAGDVASAAAAKGAAGVRAAARGTNAALAKAPGTVGGTAGAAVGGYFGGHVGAELGGAAGAMAGKELLPQVRIPGEGFGLPNRVEGGPATIPAETAAPTPTAQPTPAAVTPTPAPKVTPAAVEQQLSDALGGKKLVPGVSLKNQPAAMGVKLPEGFTPVESSVLKGYKYDPETQEFDAITNEGQRFRHGEVTPDQFQAFEDADSKGKAWNDLRNGPGVTPLGKVNASGVLQPRIKPRTVVTNPETGAPEFSDVLAAKSGREESSAQPKAKAAAASAGSDEGDLTSLLQKSLDVQPGKGGIFTTAEPGALTKRWGVSGSSIADTDANLRGLNLKQSQDYVDKLAESYKNGQPVEPVLETRDANNNIVDVDGRHRALAAQKAGIERIPIIVRRLGVTATSPAELAARP